MGICHSSKSIQQLISEKFTLAKDANIKNNINQSIHVYIWKYNTDDLKDKNIMFYEKQNNYFQKLKQNNQKPKQNNKNINKQLDNIQKIQNQEKQQIINNLIGQQLKWPFKMYSDQGYIILSIKNTKNHRLDSINNKNSFHESLFEKYKKLMSTKVSLQFLQILYMINLDSFRSQYYHQISQKQQNNQYQASIQIITGDLVQKIQSLKLITISYELQKYLRLGGQNVIKKMFNQYKNVNYLFQLNQSNHKSKRIQILEKFYQNKYMQNNHQNKQNNHQNNPIQSLNDKSQGKQDTSGFQIQIQRVIYNQLIKIRQNQNIQSQQQKQKLVYNVLGNFVKNLQSFNIFKQSLLKNLNTNNSFSLTTASILKISKQQLQIMLSNCKQKPINQKDYQSHNKFLIVQQYDRQLYLNETAYHKKNSNRLKQIKHQAFNKLIDDQDISIIQTTNDKKKKSKNEDLDSSSPFMCEITQINGLQDNQDNQLDIKGTAANNLFKKSQKQQNEGNNKQRVLTQNGCLQDSLFLNGDFEQLRVDKGIYALELGPSSQYPKQCPLLLTSYLGSCQYNLLSKNNISLMINLSPDECYNYFTNDIRYQWFYLQPINEQQKDFTRFNIQALIFNIIELARIQTIAEGNVCVFCNNKQFIYSGTICLAYLMFNNIYKLNFQHALNVVTKSTANKYFIPKIYENQLIQLQSRVQKSSCFIDKNNFTAKCSSYNGYIISLYCQKDRNLYVGRYIGQLNSSSQLQLLTNHAISAYLLMPNNFTHIFIKVINIMREDATLISQLNYKDKVDNVNKLLKNMGLTIKMLFGKELTTSQKEFYLKFVKQTFFEQLIRYEYINFAKNILNVQKYKTKIDLIIDALKQVISSQVVQKSFRKPALFEQHELSVISEKLLKKSLLAQSCYKLLPFNSHETLVFKYPILRPIFENKKKDSYYFMIRQSVDLKTKQMGCNVTFYKGQQWIGLQEDKERYFQKIVNEYLKNVNDQRIWIEDNEDQTIQKSIFDTDSIMF